MFFVPMLVGIFSAAVGTATAIGTTIVATSAITLGTMAGVVVTVGGLAATAVASAAVFGIASSLMEETNSGSNQYINENQKKYEKSKLEETLNNEIEWLIKTQNSTEDSEIIEQIKNVLREVENFTRENEYYRGINYIKNYKLTYAEHMNNQEIATEVEKIALKLIKVRKESENL